MSANIYQNLVQELYVAYFGRPADPQGMANMEAALAAANASTDAGGLIQSYGSNAAVGAIVDSFGTSKESQALYGTSNADAFVTSVFESLFNRAPAAAGLQFWSGAIQNGTLSMGDAALGIMASASASDAATVAAKVAVAESFTTSMAGSPGNASVEYEGAIAADLGRSLLSGVSSSNVNVYLTDGYVPAALVNIAGITTPLVEEDLTSGVDKLDQLVNGAIGTDNGAGATFTSGDQIIGAAGYWANRLLLQDLSTGGTWQACTVPDVTISDVRELQLYSQESVSIDTVSNPEGLTGLLFLNVQGSGNMNATAGSSTAVTVTDTQQGNLNGLPFNINVTGGTTIDIEVPNGNSNITDTASVGTVSITVGNGSNTIRVDGASMSNTVVVGTGANTIIEQADAGGVSLNVTFGAHDASVADKVYIYGAAGPAVTVSAVLTGLNTNGSDSIVFAGDSNANGSINFYAPAQIAAFGNNPTNLAAAVAGVLAAGGGNLVQHTVGEFIFQGNTYFVEQAGATGSAFAAGDTVIELTGNQSFTTATSASGGAVLLRG